MRPETIGRVLGTGLRVAGRMAGERITEAASTSSVNSGADMRGTQRVSAAPQQNAPRPPATQKTGGVTRGLAGFFKPFRDVGGKLWLEVTGVFFLLPVLVFAPTVWRTRASFAAGPDHRTFVSSAIVVIVFLYLGVTSFWRARRK